MKRRRWILVVAAVVVMATVTALAIWRPWVTAPPSGEAAAIQRVADQADLDAPKILAHYREGGGSPLDVFEAQLRFAKARNLEGCPEDFKEAFEKLIESTKAALVIARATQQTVKTMRDWETIAGMDEPSTDVEKKIHAINPIQNQAFNHLKEVAAKYGVQYGRRSNTLSEPPAAQQRSRAVGIRPPDRDSWLGVVKDKKLLDIKPESGVITDRATFTKVWQGWRNGETPPVIDFRKEIVVVVVDVFELSEIGVRRGAVDNPDVRPKGAIGIPLREVDGFSYGIARFPHDVLLREGIESINGVKLPR